LKNKYKFLFFITPLVIILDQLVKYYIDASMHLHQSIEVVENYFHITYIRNRGAAFGIFADADSSLRVPFFLTISIIAIFIIIYTIHRHKEGSKLFHLALALILGGAAGNMIDRAIMGEVIDFIDLHWHQYHWPAFNVADSAITVGAVILAASILFDKENV